MAKLSSLMSSEADLRAHIASYPELYEDLSVDALEDRLEMSCGIEFCVTDFCVVNICGVDENDGFCGIDLCNVDT